MKGEKFQYDINNATARISALSSCKIDKYSPHNTMNNKTDNFTYLSLRKVFKKNGKTSRKAS